MVESLETALNALCPRVYLHREHARGFVRLTLHSALLNRVVFERVPEPLAHATVDDLKGVLKRVTVELARDTVVREHGPVAELIAAARDLVGMCEPTLERVRGPLAPLVLELRRCLEALNGEER